MFEDSTYGDLPYPDKFIFLYVFKQANYTAMWMANGSELLVRTSFETLPKLAQIEWLFLRNWMHHYDVLTFFFNRLLQSMSLVERRR